MGQHQGSNKPAVVQLEDSFNIDVSWSVNWLAATPIVLVNGNQLTFFPELADYLPLYEEHMRISVYNLECK